MWGSMQSNIKLAGKNRWNFKMWLWLYRDKRENQLYCHFPPFCHNYTTKTIPRPCPDDHREREQKINARLLYLPNQLIASTFNQCPINLSVSDGRSIIADPHHHFPIYLPYHTLKLAFYQIPGINPLRFPSACWSVMLIQMNSICFHATGLLVLNTQIKSIFSQFLITQPKQSGGSYPTNFKAFNFTYSSHWLETHEQCNSWFSLDMQSIQLWTQFEGHHKIIQ